jgi:hypothetical protein
MILAGGVSVTGDKKRLMESRRGVSNRENFPLLSKLLFRGNLSVSTENRGFTEWIHNHKSCFIKVGL